jgi:hypothetical protein
MPPMDKQHMCPCAPWDKSDDDGDGENKEMEAPEEAHFVEMEVIPRLYMKAMYIAFFY